MFHDSDAIIFADWHNFSGYDNHAFRYSAMVGRHKIEKSVTVRACWQIQIICDEEFFRMTRRKREGVVRYVERTATQSGGKITVTVRVYQQPMVATKSYLHRSGKKFISLERKKLKLKETH